jgi:peptidoglycan/LPS O-acetylase OafA/YrhL
MLGHYFFTFFAGNSDISHLIGLPPLPGLVFPPWPFSLVADIGIVLGQFGVGVFFIISGFVIPLSFDGRIGRFLLRRALRIYPVYIVGFMIVIGFVALGDWIAGTPFPYSFWRVVSHFGVVTRGVFGFTRIDGVSWTLEVEVSFYIAFALLAPLIGRWRVPFLCAAPLMLETASFLLIQRYKNSGGDPTLALQLWVAPLLVLGLAYYLHHQRKISARVVILTNLYIALLLIVEWPSMRVVCNSQWLDGYLVAMVVFAGCYLFRAAIRPGTVLRHLSAVSYPFYVVHALSGYAIIYFLMARGLPPLPAILIAAAVVYFCALALHLAVERPAMWLSKTISVRQPAGEAIAVAQLAASD